MKTRSFHWHHSSKLEEEERRLLVLCNSFDGSCLQVQHLLCDSLFFFDYLMHLEHLVTAALKLSKQSGVHSFQKAFQSKECKTTKRRRNVKKESKDWNAVVNVITNRNSTFVQEHLNAASAACALHCTSSHYKHFSSENSKFVTSGSPEGSKAFVVLKSSQIPVEE